MDPDEGQFLDLLYAVLDVGQFLDQRADHDAHGLVVEQGHQLVRAGLGHSDASAYIVVNPQSSMTVAVSGRNSSTTAA